MPTEVLRSNVRVTVPLQPERKRPLGDGGEGSEPHFGCPMLSRTRIGMPFRGGQHVPRCSMGWTIHNEDEVLFCMHTPTRNACWKEHPERLQELQEELEEAAPAAD